MNLFRSIQFRATIILVFSSWLSPGVAQAQWIPWVASLGSLEGDDSCSAGDRDCNPCANSVREQFVSSFGEGEAHQQQNWYGSEVAYPPEQQPPSHYFSQGSHVQGFVRTYSSTYPFIGSFSVTTAAQKKGSLFFLGKGLPNTSDFRLQQIFSIKNSRHPSGLSVLGQFLVFTDGSHHLRRIDIERSPLNHEIITRIDGLGSGGGGIALVKAKMGGYYLITSDNISASKKEPGVRFYYIAGSLEAPHSVTPLGSWDSPTSTTYERENVSLVTECGTRDIYAVHTSTSDSAGVQGHFRLWRFDTVPSGLRLTEAGLARAGSHYTSCDFRSATTVFVTGDHKLRGYCHGNGKEWITGTPPFVGRFREIY